QWSNTFRRVLATGCEIAWYSVEATYSSSRQMPNTIAAVSCQPSPRSAASAISTAPPASAAAAPTPWVSALANSSRGSWTMAGAVVIGTPCAVRVEQSFGRCLRAALPCRVFALEQLNVVAVALHRHGIADEDLAPAL